jgi:hypothetical protein
VEQAHAQPAGAQGQPAVPTATKFYQRAGPGGSSAVLLGFSDGIKRAAKLAGNPQSSIVLVNELVVARLAEALGAPCPRGTVVMVEQPMVDASKAAIPELGAAKPGHAFGSEWIEGQYNPGEQICSTAANREKIAGLMTLYTWVGNSDLKGEHLLWRMLPDGSHEVFGFDHGHCFGSPQWDGSIRDRAANVALRTLPQFSVAIGRESAQAFAAQLEQVTRGQIDGAVRGVPPDWGVAAETFIALADYLDRARTPAATLVRQTFP